MQEKTDSKKGEREVMAVVEKSEKKAKKAAVRSGDKCLSKKKIRKGYRKETSQALITTCL